MLMIQRIFFVIIALWSWTHANSQILEPIEWSASLDMTGKEDGVVKLDAYIDKGWHLYGFNLPSGGPVSTTITFDLPKGVQLDGDIHPSVAPVEKKDLVFNLDLSWWADDVQFKQKIKLDSDYDDSNPLVVKVRFQGCDDRSCLAPQTMIFDLNLPQNLGKKDKEEQKNLPVESQTKVNSDISVITNDKSMDHRPDNNDSINSTLAEVKDIITQENSGLSVTLEEKWWTPVKFLLHSDETAISETPWWHIFIWGFGGGLLALLTPCVWPLIPMTVSFFLKKSSSRKKAIGDAITYGISIIVLYLVLGLAITLIFGASKLNDLATNAIFNLCFFLLLIIFAISFFGAFNISLPSKWSNSVDSKAEKTTGLISIFFMAFTLALVSFSCTGPIIGTLLVEAASMGDITGPAIGMGAFSLALAIPFTLFAIFPSWLKEMPRSGGWLNSVKVVLGFLELALSLKFLSVADLAYGWGILDREVFICLWVVIFAMLGLYLLGKLKFAHDDNKDHVSIMSFFFSLISFSFALYLIPGLWGAPLKGVSAFVPPLYTQDFNLYSGGQFEEFDDYDEGMAYALNHQRPVLIDFSGYGCVNCRKMEGAVFDTPEVEREIKENFVLIKLMVDDKAKLKEPIRVNENGRNIVLETVGDKWSYLQRMKFGANSQPYYVILNNEGNPLERPYYYDENVHKFLGWLNQGLEAYISNSNL